MTELHTPVIVRPAVTSDMPQVAQMMQPFVERKILLPKDMVTLYESTADFMVAEGADGALQGFGALHIMWQHLGEVRTLAVADSARGLGVGHKLLERIEQKAVELGLKQLVCLTFETGFFERHGYVPIGEGTDPISPQLYDKLLLSHDEEINEFLAIAREKPNTLGNTRMMKKL